MVKKYIVFTVLAAAMATTLCADPMPHKKENNPPARNGETPQRNRPRMSPPVYATAGDSQRHTAPENMSQAERGKFDEARRRRFEIMVLINACKIMPEADRAPLKAELLKRIDTDFQAMVVDQKERIARAEAELQRLRKELDEREKKREELVKQEFDRLLNMPVPDTAPAGKRNR